MKFTKIKHLGLVLAVSLSAAFGAEDDKSSKAQRSCTPMGPSAPPGSTRTTLQLAVLDGTASRLLEAFTSSGAHASQRKVSVTPEMAEALSGAALSPQAAVDAIIQALAAASDGSADSAPDCRPCGGGGGGGGVGGGASGASSAAASTGSASARVPDEASFLRIGRALLRAMQSMAGAMAEQRQNCFAEAAAAFKSAIALDPTRRSHAGFSGLADLLEAYHGSDDPSRCVLVASAHHLVLLTEDETPEGEEVKRKFNGIKPRIPVNRRALATTRGDIWTSIYTGGRGRPLSFDRQMGAAALPKGWFGQLLLTDLRRSDNPQDQWDYYQRLATAIPVYCTQETCVDEMLRALEAAATGTPSVPAAQDELLCSTHAVGLSNGEGARRVLALAKQGNRSAQRAYVTHYVDFSEGNINTALRYALGLVRDDEDRAELLKQLRGVFLPSDRISSISANVLSRLLRWLGSLDPSLADSAKDLVKRVQEALDSRPSGAGQSEKRKGRASKRAAVASGGGGGGGSCEEPEDDSSSEDDDQPPSSAASAAASHPGPCVASGAAAASVRSFSPPPVVPPSSSGAVESQRVSTSSSTARTSPRTSEGHQTPPKGGRGGSPRSSATPPSPPRVSPRTGGGEGASGSSAASGPGEARPYAVALLNQARKDLKGLGKGDAKNQAWIRIQNDIQRDPFGTGNDFEALTGPLSGLFSRRLNQVDRVVYRVDERSRTIYVMSILGHYGD